MAKSIDLNCDMGEGWGVWRIADDAALLPWITSANIACGGHAGDPDTMHETVSAAVEAGVRVGAHVGLPDKAGFGRRVLALTPAELYTQVVAQIGALAAIARVCGAALTHVKLHGALYHMVEDDAALAAAAIRACKDLVPELEVLGLAGGAFLRRAAAAGLRVRHEAFVDRRYLDDGTLMPRGEAGAVLEDPLAVLDQALRLARTGTVITASGTERAVRADTLCVHGDHPRAVDVARSVHQGLRLAGVRLGVRLPVPTTTGTQGGERE